METPSSWVTCDGCGLPASPAHIAERLQRLELATRFRPIHVSLLFVAAAPSIRPEDDFYRPSESREFFNRFLDAVEIPAPGNTRHSEEDPQQVDVARLVEFQRRGYYLSYLSECPLPDQEESVSAAISRLGATLLRRIRLNYKPRQIAILGRNLGGLLDIFENAGVPSTNLSFLEVPNAGNTAGASRFRATLASLAPHDNLAPKL